MRTTIDKAGRVVIPIGIRHALALDPGTELDVRMQDGHVELSPVTPNIRLVERDGIHVLEADGPMSPLTTEMVREVLEQVRDRR